VDDSFPPSKKSLYYNQKEPTLEAEPSRYDDPQFPLVVKFWKARVLGTGMYPVPHALHRSWGEVDIARSS
jgi:hypothetical protein